MQQLAIVTDNTLAIAEPIATPHLVKLFFDGLKPSTRQAYKNCWKHHCRWANLIPAGAVSDAELADACVAAADLLIQIGPGKTYAQLMAYRAAMMADDMSGNSINLRISAVRSFLNVARRSQVISWTVDIPTEKTAVIRDTRGPGVPAIRKMLDIAGSQKNPAKAARDCAIIQLLFATALRRGEVIGLELKHIDLEGSRVEILGKGRGEREWITMPAPVRTAVGEWLGYRALMVADTEAVFLNFDRANRSAGALTGDGAYQLIARLGKKAGVKTRPHALRHSGITAALDATKGSIRDVQQFSRHATPDMVMHYDDRREDVAGAVANQVAALL